MHMRYLYSNTFSFCDKSNTIVGRNTRLADLIQWSWICAIEGEVNLITSLRRVLSSPAIGYHHTRVDKIFQLGPDVAILVEKASRFLHHTYRVRQRITLC